MEEGRTWAAGRGQEKRREAGEKHGGVMVGERELTVRGRKEWLFLEMATAWLEMRMSSSCGVEEG